MTQPLPEPGIRRLIAASVMAATVMTSLDSTIANVALPHIQGSVSASQEEITWVLTSYIVVAAIFTPLTGWLAGRVGRRRLMTWSIAGFTLTSVLCGFASNLDELVIFRVLQGMCGAALVPMSQAILLDINPPERHGPAMAIWGMGAILGPIVGPTLGGWLTENLDWRWVFFINLPIGVFAFAGLSAFLPDMRHADRVRLDMFGFATLALALGAFQLMLDRGQSQDWFDSTEICVEASLAGLFAVIFVIHSATARTPFIDLALFADRNFVITSIFGFLLGFLIFSILALLPPMLEGLMGYPVVLTGLVTAPRGLGTMISMILVGQAIRRVDARLLVLAGLILAGVATWNMSGFSLGMDQHKVIVSGFVQGLGTGLIFVPLSTMTFATMAPRLRNDAAAISTLIRNLGSAIGISVLQTVAIRNSAVVHSRLVESVRPDNPALAVASPGFDFGLPEAVAQMNAAVTRQAMMVGYVDAFWALFVMTVASIPMLLLLRKPRQAAVATDELPMHMD